jgi:hypothetical protein
MESITFNGKEIEITSVYFSNNREQLRFQSYPRRLVYQGREYILAES